MHIVLSSQSLEENQHITHAGTAVRVEISAPVMTLSADEVTMFTAELYDSVNNLVSGDVVWSSSNGSISPEGMFYPWNSGMITIEANHNGIVGSLNISVTAGVGQSLEITSLNAHVLAPVTLTANLLDARGNAQLSQDAVWTVDGNYVGVGSPLWTPEDVGEFSIRVRLHQMEHVSNIHVTAGSPYEFIFEEGLQVRSGHALFITPQLLDINGFAMNVTEAGNRAWTVENGSILPSGWFTASHPGVWNITVSAGNVTGFGTVRVVPADAAISQVVVLSDDQIFIAGTSYEVAAMRTDSQGYTGPITPPLENFSVTSGGLAAINDAVYWTPGAMGMHEIRVVDDGVVSTLTVEVVHGNAIDTYLKLSSTSAMVAGEQSTILFHAVDVIGNEWMVNGSLTMVNGNESQFTEYNGYATVTPRQVQIWRVEGSWFDFSTETRFEPVFQMQSKPGRLAFIQLNGEGAILPSDTSLSLDPMFYDAYSNSLESIRLNWTVDGSDATVDILLSDLHWIPTNVGGHEIRANADGVFATIRLTVVAGDARNLVTDQEDGLVVQAGVASELFIQTIDAHGNLAPSTEVVSVLDNKFGTLEASSSGNGYWNFIGQTAGTYTLELVQDGAVHSIPLTVGPGVAVRLDSSIEDQSIAQGDTVLLRVQGVDMFDNLVEVDADNTTVSCTSGSAKHVTGDTWELDVSSAGNDRSCNILWSGLISQNYFDVEAVLLGGAVGSTNTAMGLGIFLLTLILVTLVVLVRRANQQEDDDEWAEDAFDDDDEYDEEENEEDDSTQETSSESSSMDDLVKAHQTNKENASEDSGGVLTDELRATLAQQAAEIGVMQAAPGTVQGSSGWYVDISSEVQYWNVGADGSWTRGD
tara:strand:- start:3048 stop:5651 length:2604 start_codon:yes stop_codon:yes gene_type:complete